MNWLLCIAVPLHLVLMANGDRWSGWAEWSKCSRSCGVGVSFQTRSCLNSTGGTGIDCGGAKRQNRLCNIQDCSSEEPDFRAQQCAAYNAKKYKGKLFQWAPIKRDAFPCELTCMPKGQRFYVKFSNKVVDGTKCEEGSSDVCIDGRCENVGCDLRLNSNAEFDNCRECNGKNRNCQLVRGKFELKKIESDYIEMLNIPARTTTITIKEEGTPRNYLALKNYKGDYVLNGHWTISNPGLYKLNGHYAVYKRNANENSIRINGPIDAPITVETLALDGPLSFSYEYYVPNELDNTIPQTTYSWVVKSRGECSTSCAGGVRRREAACIASNDGRSVSGLLCDKDARPSDTEECNTEPCPTHWFVGEWSSCSTSCGAGEKVRRVHCVREVKGGQIEMMVDSQCSGSAPAKYEKCEIKKVCPTWKRSDWSTCSKTCGSGIRSRTVACVGVSGASNNVLAESSCDMTIKPILQQPCNLGTCNLTWVLGSWSQCSAHCGKGVRNRQITCQNNQGSVFPAGYCDKIFKPHEIEDCFVSGPCPPMWYTTQWSKCSRDCGYGIQIRMIYCAEKAGSSLRIIDASGCKDDEKPIKMQKCHHKKPCISQYFASLWKPCSASCGTGLRVRRVRCYADARIDYSETTCKHLSKPVSVELCNRRSCSGINGRENLDKLSQSVTTRKPKGAVSETKEARVTTQLVQTSRPATERQTPERRTTKPPTTIPTTTELPTTTVPIVTTRTEKPTPRPIPAIILKYQGPESIDEDDAVDYYCNTMGEPTPEIIWTFNGKRVEEMGSRFLLLSLKTHLVITSVQKGDNGILTCQAKNIGGMDSKSLNLKVTSSPSVVVTPTNAQLKEGNSFFMTCETTAFPEAKSVWRKDGRKFFGDSNRVVVSDTMIRFKTLLPADSGRYECYAENAIGTDTKSMSLTVEADQSEGSCVDDPERANCDLIKRYNLCTHPFYSAHCCKTCSSK